MPPVPTCSGLHLHLRYTRPILQSRHCLHIPSRRLFLIRWQSSATSSPTNHNFDDSHSNSPSPTTLSPSTTPSPALHRSPGLSPFIFACGYAGHPKRKHSRPFPPPFLSRPSGSFSDPLSPHHS